MGAAEAEAAATTKSGLLLVCVRGYIFLCSLSQLGYFSFFAREEEPYSFVML